MHERSSSVKLLSSRSLFSCTDPLNWFEEKWRTKSVLSWRIDVEKGPNRSLLLKSRLYNLDTFLILSSWLKWLWKSWIDRLVKRNLGTLPDGLLLLISRLSSLEDVKFTISSNWLNSFSESWIACSDGSVERDEGILPVKISYNSGQFGQVLLGLTVNWKLSC